MGGCLFVPGLAAGGRSDRRGPAAPPEDDKPTLADNRLTSYFDAAVSAGEKEHSSNLGRLPTDLGSWKPEDVASGYIPFATTVLPMRHLLLDFESISKGQICFTYFDSGMKASEDAKQLGRQTFDSVELATEAVEGRKATEGRKIWPPDGSRLNQVEVVSDEIKDKDTPSGIVRQRTITWRFCGAAPVLGPKAKYLAVFVHQKESLAPFKDFGLLLWSLGTPTK